MTVGQTRLTTSWSGERRSFPARTRRAILARDGYRCVRCGHEDPSGRTLVADHVIAHAEGGGDDVDNGQTLCTACHAEKTHVERLRGRARMPTRKRPATRHPGLLNAPRNADTPEP